MLNDPKTLWYKTIPMLLVMEITNKRLLKKKRANMQLNQFTNKGCKDWCCRCYSSAPSVEHLSNIYKYICKTKRASIYATYTYIYDYILIGYFCYA